MTQIQHSSTSSVTHTNSPGPASKMNLSNTLLNHLALQKSDAILEGVPLPCTMPGFDNKGGHVEALPPNWLTLAPSGPKADPYIFLPGGNFCSLNRAFWNTVHSSTPIEGLPSVPANTSTIASSKLIGSVYFILS